jgi:hypothetical protein
MHSGLNDEEEELEEEEGDSARRAYARLKSDKVMGAERRVPLRG